MDKPNLYHEIIDLSERDTLWAMNEIWPKLSWNENRIRVLDIGCGSGEITKNLLLPKLPGDVIQLAAIDCSKEMLEYAAKNYHHNLISYHQLDILDGFKIKQLFPDGFSKVCSFYCLHRIQEQGKCLEVIFNLLENGGQAFFMFLTRHQYFNVCETLSVNPKWAKYMQDIRSVLPPQFYQEYPAVEFRKLAENVGFEVESCEDIELTYAFRTKDKLRNLMASVNPFLCRIPTDEKESYISDSVEEIIQVFNKTDPSPNLISRYSLMVTLLRKK